MGQYGSSFLFTPDCEDKKPQTVEWTGSAFSSANAGIAELGERLDVINRKICDLDVVAAVPEGWNLRPENGRPQLIVKLAGGNPNHPGSADRQLTIPHYAGPRKVPPISYTSGRFYGILVLSDNSKVRVYANSQRAAESVCNQVRVFIDGSMLQNSFIVTGEVKQNIKSASLRAKKATFYGRNHEPGKAPVWVASVK